MHVMRCIRPDYDRRIYQLRPLFFNGKKTGQIYNGYCRLKIHRLGKLVERAFKTQFGYIDFGYLFRHVKNFSDTVIFLIKIKPHTH